MSEAAIVRAAEQFHARHNAMLAGAATVVEVQAAEEALHVAIWEHFEPDGEVPKEKLP